MPTLPGNRIQAGAIGRLPAPRQAIEVRGPVLRNPPDGLAAYSLQAGTFGGRQPIAIRSLAYTGLRQRSFFDDFYSQVYFIPVFLDFGTISGAVIRTVYAWNANFRPAILKTITPRTIEGVSIETEDLPLTFKPLQLQHFTFTAYDNVGDITLDGWADFAFEGGEQHSVKLEGVRARLAPFVPNWRETYTVAYEFKTDIFTSTSGKEQRRALRQAPRKRLEFTVTAKNELLRQIQGTIVANQNLPLVIAESPRMVSTTARQLAGTGAVAVDDTPDWLVPQATVLAVHGAVSEVRKVAAAGGGSVAFAAEATIDWPPETRIYALVRGYLETSISMTRKTNTVAEMTMKVSVPPGSEVQAPLPAPPLMFNGRELWNHRPNWKDDPDFTYDHDRVTVDYGWGRTADYQIVPFGTMTGKWTFLGRNWHQVELMRQFFERQRGQRGEFYMPTWNADIAIVRPSPINSQVLRVHGTQFSKDFGSSTIHKAVAVLMRSGVWHYNLVESIGLLRDEYGDDSGIQVRDPWPEELRPDTVSMICWMPVWRFAVDELSVAWATNSVAQISLAMKTLEDLA
jgi:hypothetical protein